MNQKKYRFYSMNVESEKKKIKQKKKSVNFVFIQFGQRVGNIVDEIEIYDRDKKEIL